MLLVLRVLAVYGNDVVVVWLVGAGGYVAVCRQYFGGEALNVRGEGLRDL